MFNKILIPEDKRKVVSPEELNRVQNNIEVVINNLSGLLTDLENRVKNLENKT